MVSNLARAPYGKTYEPALFHLNHLGQSFRRMIGTSNDILLEIVCTCLEQVGLRLAEGSGLGKAVAVW